VRRGAALATGPTRLILPRMSASPIPDALIPDDRVAPFQIEGEPVRGRLARLGPAVDPTPADPSRSPVARAIRIAREAALRGRPASHGEVEPTRVALIEQVQLRWQDARISAHLHPHALHAVESALFGAERAKDDTHLDQLLLSMEHGVAEIVYPDLIWRPIPALWSHFASLPGRAIQADRQWLMAHGNGNGDGVHPSFFDRELWPDGTPSAWDDHIAHFRDRLFGESRDVTVG